MSRRLLYVLVLFCRLGGAVRAAETKVAFSSSIRPVLSNTCFVCHGPDENHREAELRLDLREEAIAEHDGHFAIVPGKPEASELIRRITSDDPDLRMPPPDSGKTLTKEQIENLKLWVSQGAEYSPHWSFLAPQKPAVPAVAEGWAKNPIDRYVAARLEKEGLTPSSPADKVTLLRRLSFDLIGLPPTSAEVDAFLADTSADAYSQQVERLLASPHYGERWGRAWLDAARYADSNGFEKDKPRNMWCYRDWVVQSLNDDLPYDQFIVKQIAGDLLPSATQDDFVATGFLRGSMTNEEGGIDPEQFRMVAMFDRIETIGKGILGLTVNCTQCHTHKYDPITHEEYYRMFACLNDADEGEIPTYSKTEQRQRHELLGEISRIEKTLQERDPGWLDRMNAWAESERRTQPHWTNVRVENIGDNAQRYIYHQDGSITAAGYCPPQLTAQFRGTTGLTRIAAFQLEVLCDPSLPLGGPGRSVHGLFGLTEFEVEAANPEKPESKRKVRLVAATSDFANPEAELEARFDNRSGHRRVTGPVQFAIDGWADTAWGIDHGPGRSNAPRKAVFVPADPLELEGGWELTFSLAQNHGGWNGDDNQINPLGRFRLSVTDASNVVADPLPAAVRAAVELSADQRTSDQIAAMFSYWRTLQPTWTDANASIEALWQKHPQGSSQLAMLARKVPRETHLLERGDQFKPGRVVQPGVPASLNPIPENEPINRLRFAQWLVDPKTPTTARALVNRVWQQYFGTGIVATTEDLGSQCEPPSHPELLDWLAIELQQNGWRLKPLHRLIVSSATYQQASSASGEAYAHDPANRLLARGPRFRLDAEAIRDTYLAASGLLNLEIGGPAVHPPAPAFLFLPPSSFGAKSWEEDKDAQRYRRALYTFRFRTATYPMLQTFDAPTGEFACARRTLSNTPLQALTLLNEPMSLECAKGLARATLSAGGSTDADRIQYAFRRCTARSASAAEQTRLAKFLATEQDKMNGEPTRPLELLGVTDEKNLNFSAASPAQYAAWTALSRVLLSLDETITKE